MRSTSVSVGVDDELLPSAPPNIGDTSWRSVTQQCSPDGDCMDEALNGSRRSHAPPPLPNNFLPQGDMLSSTSVPTTNSVSPSNTPPFATKPSSSSSSTSSSIIQPATATHSPWHALAATSGAMTPSVEVPSLQPRGSPQLGRPFERLNLGNTWSATNLGGDDTPAKSPSPQFQQQSSRPSFTGGVIAGGGVVPRQFTASPSSFAQRRPMSLSLGSPFGGSQPVANSSPLAGPSSSKVKPLPPSAVRGMLSSGSTLLLDIRPPSSYRESHIRNAHSTPIPSTLLRRKGFGLSKLCDMLTAPSREAVSQWRDMADIVIVDQDSTTASDGSVLHGLTSKFEREGFTGKLWFIAGGQTAVEAEDGVDMVSDESEEAKPSNGTEEGSTLGSLPRLAFQQASTKNPNPLPLTATAAFRNGNTLFSFGSAPVTAHRHARSNEPSGGARLQPANPFFDNIRQNMELSQGVTERIPLSLPENMKRRASELPKFLQDLVKMDDSQTQEVLADQFYRIELGEQKRLQSVMDILTKGSCAPDSSKPQPVADCDTIRSADAIEQLLAGNTEENGYYPFSITAGVERGTKNRYKNIWPYDYSRVRLETPCDDNSDYINASFVQPRGTARRYIATQGPLDATYRDFWTLIWEQNVRVIVMLTKQFEGGLLKCGNYWQEQQYGSLHLRLVSHVGGEDAGDVGQSTGFDFGVAANAPSSGESGSIKRTFHLWHDGDPRPPRVITQIQCVDWPDYDVPETPNVLINLIKDVDRAVTETGLVGCGEDRCLFPPVLVHCSAGVGRTGSYILVDAIADALRREFVHGRDQAHQKSSSSGSAVESTASVASSSPRTSLIVPEALQTTEPRRKSTTDVAEMDLDSGAGGGDASVPPKAHTWQGGDDREKPRPITQSHRPHKPSTPLSAMEEPILEVLQGMRVQRMSLVQSLRQYVFVHRAIIAYYLEMSDDHTRQSSVASSDLTSSHSRTSLSTCPTSTSTSMDDESHFKRKPSATDLRPEVDVRLQSIANVHLAEGAAGAVNLAKRASFKKRRGLNDEKGNLQSVPADTPVGATPPMSPSATPLSQRRSPQMPRRADLGAQRR